MDNQTKYAQEVLTLSDDDLKEILINRTKYNGWLITNARKELEKRGITLTADELNQINVNKKKRIDEVKADAKIKINENWYNYREPQQNKVNIEYEEKSYFKRILGNIVRSLIVNIIVFTGFIASFINKYSGEYTFYYLIHSQFLIILACLIFISFIFDLIESLYQNRYYLLKIIADSKGISFDCLKINEFEHFYSNWQQVEIRKRYTQFKKNVQIILILKYQNKTCLKIYDSENKKLDRNHLEQLINRLSILKKQAH